MSYAYASRTPQRSNARHAGLSQGLRIGEPNDAYEQEAEQVAEVVISGKQPRLAWSLSNVNSISAPLRRQCSCGGSSDSAEACEECRKKETLQRRANGAAAPEFAPPIVNEVLRSPGRPLDRPTSRLMEASLGHDLSRVRIHSDAAASASAKAVSAKAYTVGDHVVFGSGQFQPENQGGLRLLAHELAHVVQQQSRPAPRMQRQPDDAQQSDEQKAAAAKAYAEQDEVFASLYSALYAGVESLQPSILLAYADNLETKYEAAQASGKSPKSQLALASALARIHDTLVADEGSAERDADGALLEQEFGKMAPWSSVRPHSVSEIPVFSAEHVLAWQADAAVYDKQNQDAQPGARKKSSTPSAPPGFSTLVTGSGTPSAVPASASDPNAAPSAVDPAAEQSGHAAMPPVEVQERSPAEKAAVNEPAGGTEIKDALEALKSRTLSSLPSSLPKDKASGSNPAQPAAGDDPDLLEASAQIWFISNRLYVLDRTGHLQAAPDGESWFDVASVGGMQPGGIYFIRPVQEKGINFRGDVVKGGVTGGEHSEEVGAAIYFPRVLTALIPMLALNAALAKQQAGVAVVVAKSFAQKRLTVSDISFKKLLQALGKVPHHLLWAIKAELIRIKQDPLGEICNQAMGLGIEYLTKFAAKAAPGVGEALLLYQLLELSKWLGEVANVAAYAQTDDEIDIAAQAIAQKLAQFLVFEAISRSLKAGVRIAGGVAGRVGGRSSKAEGAEIGKPAGKAPTPEERPPAEESPSAAASAKENAPPAKPAQPPAAENTGRTQDVPSERPAQEAQPETPPSRPAAGEEKPAPAKEPSRPPEPAREPEAAQPGAARESRPTPQSEPPTPATGAPPQEKAPPTAAQESQPTPQSKQPAAATGAKPQEEAPPTAGAQEQPQSASPTPAAPTSTPTTPGVHAIDDVLSADRADIAASDPTVRSRFTPEQAEALDRLQSAYQSYKADKKKAGADALSAEEWLRAQKTGQPRGDAEALFGKDYARTGRAASAGARPQIVLQDIPRPTAYSESRLQTDLQAVRSDPSVWNRLAALRSKGVTNGEIDPGLLNILKGNIGEILARPTLEARLKGVQEKIPGARIEFNTQVAKRRPDGGFEAPKLFSDGLIVSEPGGKLQIHDAFEVKSGGGGGAEATSQFFEWREGRLEDGDQLVLSDGRRFTYAPDKGGPGTVRGMQTATPHIVAARGAEHLGAGSGEQVAAGGTRTALPQTASEIEYLARQMLESLPQNVAPQGGPTPAGVGSVPSEAAPAQASP